ncbi:hypothetical protein OIDMADRAFT_18874 [Oidiodendron maius Zn]|uniref:Uncharacterized protein n=1 Tax=Oidiodendron maius (strain Zn) TaxID=913774 RepID=A0A0C3HGG8_OIDMZ|nr:hypothetical protein OIDMADRAFT_18874 [Oidiodendron maius Zn]
MQLQSRTIQQDLKSKVQGKENKPVPHADITHFYFCPPKRCLTTLKCLPNPRANANVMPDGRSMQRAYFPFYAV